MFSEKNNPEPPQNPDEQPEARTPEVDPAAAHEQQPNPAETAAQQAEVDEQSAAVSGIRAAAQERIRQHRINKAQKDIEKASETEARMDRKDAVHDHISERATTPHKRDDKAVDLEKSMTLPEKARAWYVGRKAKKNDWARAKDIQARRIWGEDHTERVPSVRKAVTDTVLHPTVGAEAPTISPSEAVKENTKQAVFVSPIVYNEKDETSPSAGHEIIDILKTADNAKGELIRPDGSKKKRDEADNLVNPNGIALTQYEIDQIKENQDLIRVGEKYLLAEKQEMEAKSAGQHNVVSAPKDKQKFDKQIQKEVQLEKKNREARNKYLDEKKEKSEFTTVTVDSDQDMELLRLQKEHGLVDFDEAGSVSTTRDGKTGRDVTTVKLKTRGLTRYGRLWERGKNLWAHLAGDRSPQDYADIKGYIKAAPVHHSNAEWRRVRRDQRRREESLNFAADQPVLSWWRNRRREKAQKKIEEAQEIIDRHGGVPA